MTEPSGLTLEQEALVQHEDRLIALESRLTMPITEQPPTTTEPLLTNPAHVPPIPVTVDPPVVHHTLDALVDAHAETRAQTEENTAKIEAKSYWRNVLDDPTGKLVVTTAGMAFVTLMGVFVAWVTGKLTLPTPVVNVPPAQVVIEKPADKPAASPCLNPTGCKCGCVTTGNCVCKNCDVPMMVAPKVDPVVAPDVPKANANSVVIYATTGFDAKALLADPELKGLKVSIAEKVYEVGAYYPWNDKKIPLPCVTVVDHGGKVIDVQALAPTASGADVAALLKGK
jgi:hypothetical protein